ncbi:MAG: DNA recombination protein RmuC [Muribaculaceae bacterium]|nr:DNA recombination protein RmuC [Muribaculaceae bacterium]
MIAVYIVIGFFAGILITFLFTQHQLSKLRVLNGLLKEDKERLDRENNHLLEENKTLLVEKSSMKSRIEVLDSNEENLKKEFDIERKRWVSEKESAEVNAEKLRNESDRQWQIKFDKLKEEFHNIANQLLSAKQNSLQQNNREQLGEMLKPIQQQFDVFRKSLEESKTSTEVAKKELKDSFESTLRLFVQQQSQAVDAIKKETIRIGNDANNLTKALKRDTKKQGDWGEYILETLLDSSGLVKNIHYFIQETVKDEEGALKRPDVIVKFPEGKSVIIDSKVSLTAYTESFETDDETLQRRRLKDHARSVRKHVEELADKKYDTLVKDSIGFILMFIPNDQCYLSALEEDPDISRYAYHKGVVIISPSNLMMALQLAHNLWQQDLRNKNIDNIVKSANDLYEKVATFSETIDNLDRLFNNLANEFHKAKNQMYEGKGNIFKKVENLKNLGISPKKQIKGLDTE